MANPKRPKALVDLEGNPGKRPQGGPEPEFLKCQIGPPPELHEYAKDEWWRLAPQLEKLGMLDDGSFQSFSLYCKHIGDEKRYREELDRGREEVLKQHPNHPMRGDVVRFASGALGQHPLVGMINTKAELARKMLLEFGFTPSSKSRIAVAILDDEEKDSLAAHNKLIRKLSRPN